ncbi:hypothetical protein BH10BAC5_BH10BAC5_22870 [soil metagenome]
MDLEKFIDKGEIEVSKKTLLHISEGIYRTEGSALKELINNSFDANANKVIINTNYPQFDILTIQDDGDGMTENEFLRIVKGGIGDSPKASSKNNKRPIIGRLGIGILSVAQICRSFTIISHCEKSKTAFRGKMIFRTDVDEVAKKENKESYDIGKWQLEEKINYDKEKKGVLIFTKDLRQSFLKRFRENSAIINHTKNTTPVNYDHLIELYYNNNYKMVKEQGPYYELIWELCNLLPLPYLNKTPLREKLGNKLVLYNKRDQKIRYESAVDFISKKNEELISYNFSVIFDDIKLFRPIKLPYPILNNSGSTQEVQLFYFEYDNIVRKRRLKCYGYFFAQEMAIKPRDLKGIQIRIKNVGIGVHDATFMKYGKIEAPRDNWLTGEIYVEEGLESALNIDRDSFNENDEHYYILKEQIHKYLSEIVFPTISSFQRKRNIAKREINKENYLTYYKSNLNRTLKKYFIKFEFLYKTINNFEIDKKKKILIIPSELITTNSDFKMEIFSKSAITLLDFLRVELKNPEDIENAFKEISKVILS